ncbi:tetratricopeptide repeat protein [Vibrio parahaemolyticus]|uniref:tetratricopeptide repeat protein n=1 Tax=Vibrio parahaemolyticus TaxID=670 RepID=UPI0030061148
MTKIRKAIQSYQDALNWINHKNYKEAFDSFTKAYKLGYTQAAANLGLMYLKGEHVEVDYKEALSYFLQAVDFPDSNAAYNAARILSSGDAGYVDIEQAISLYDIAVRHGDKEAANNLGILFLEDKHIPKDEERAISYLDKATELGHERSPHSLASIYINRDLDIEKAKSLLELSLSRGFIESALSLGKLYSEGYFTDAGDESYHDKYFDLVESGDDKETKLELALYLSSKPDLVSFSRAKDIIYNLILDDYKPAVNMFSHKIVYEFYSDTNSDLYKEINDLISELYLVVAIIKESHAFYFGSVSHFTSWQAMESILSLEKEGNCLRYYHVDYMNDPSEGKTLLNYSCDKDTIEHKSTLAINSFVSEVFDIKSLVKDTLPSVYSLSFTSESDRLDLWRAYGSDGDGYSITIEVNEQRNYERSSFSQGAFSPYITFGKKPDVPLINKNNGIGKNNSKIPKLYRVKYDSPSIEKTLNLLSKPLSSILEKLKVYNIEHEFIESVKLSVASILLDIMYLYKDEQYSTEKEVRAIRVEPLHNVRLDERKPVARLFCTTDNFLFTTPNTKITVGPKVEEKLVSVWNLRYRINEMKFSETTSVEVSNVQYR